MFPADASTPSRTSRETASFSASAPAQEFATADSLQESSECNGSEFRASSQEAATEKHADPEMRRPHFQSEDALEEQSYLTGGNAASGSWLPDSQARRLRYDDFATIDWMYDFACERLRLTHLRETGSWFVNLADASQAWALVSAIGCVTGAIAAFIVIAEEWLFDLRSGYCSDNWYLNKRFCCFYPHTASELAASAPFSNASEGDSENSSGAFPAPCDKWVVWSHAWWGSFALYLLSAFAMATLAAFLVKRLAPYAAGSGIPEVKTILGGFVMRSFLGVWTLMVKAIGLPLATASGMSVGKEGPLVHVACCVGNIFPRIFSKFRNNEAKKREILSAAAAAGVACAFGAPIGGVLFSLEEVSYYFPYKTMLRSFFSAMMAAAMLKILNPLHTGKLVLFQVKYESTWHSFDVIFFVLLGVLGGLFGTFFIRTNLKIVSMRKNTRLNLRPVQEASVVALVTAFFSFLNNFLYISSGSLISSLFSECKANPGGLHSNPASIESEVPNLCNESMALKNVYLLIVAALTKTVLTAVTFGTRVPCGVFIPVFAVGACIGRAVGIGVAWLQSSFPALMELRGCILKTATVSAAIAGASSAADGSDLLRPSFSYSCVQPGPYALLGAAAFLAGVTRMTVSLVVIMFEITGALDYILPIMITVMVAKIVGDAFSKESIYDGLIRLNGYPYLSPQEEYNQLLEASDVMIPTSELEVLPADTATVGTLEYLLLNSKVSGFPVVKSNDCMQAIGYISARELQYALHEARNTNAAVSNNTHCSFGPLSDSHYFTFRNDTSSTHISVHGQSREDMGRSLGGNPLGNSSIGDFNYWDSETRSFVVSRSSEADAELETSGRFYAAHFGKIDLQPWIDPAPITIVPRYSMEMTIELFKKMGLRYILVTRDGSLQGLITKKDILRHLGRISVLERRTQEDIIASRLVG